MVVLAPAIGALVGIGTVDLWRARQTNRRLAGLALAAAIGISAALAWELLNRTPNFLPGLRLSCWSSVSVTAAVIAVIAVLPEDLPADGRSRRPVPRRWPRRRLASPRSSPGRPHTRSTRWTPRTTVATRPPDRRMPAPCSPVCPGSRRRTRDPTTVAAGSPATAGRAAPASPLPGNGFTIRAPGGMNDADIAYLIANRGNARWIVARVHRPRPRRSSSRPACR